LAQFAKVDRKDWKKHYGDNLDLIDPLVDPALFKGTSCRAAGWTQVGMTKGIGGKGRDRPVDGRNDGKNQ